MPAIPGACRRMHRTHGDLHSHPLPSQPHPFPKPPQRIKLQFAELVDDARRCPVRKEPLTTHRHSAPLSASSQKFPWSFHSFFHFWILNNVLRKPGPNYSPLPNAARSKSPALLQ